MTLISTPHPLYAGFLDEWSLMRDTYRGEDVVKAASARYLPPTAGMVIDGMQVNQPGWEAYQAYKTRAVFHPLVADAVETMVGMMHTKDPKIELPTALEPLRTRATVKGETLVQLLRRINEQQLVMGRVGLMADMPARPLPDTRTPYIATYLAEHIINWDEGTRDDGSLPKLNLVILNETGFERQADFSWHTVEKYRVLFLGDVNDNEAGPAPYAQQLVRANDKFDPLTAISPSIAGRTLDEIPFTFINTKDIVPPPDCSPLAGLARAVIAMYRGEADYRQNLFMQGQDTLVVIGQTTGDDVRLGAGSTLYLPSGGDAKFIGVTSSGLAEQRQALDTDYQRAMLKAGAVVDPKTRSRESGDALKTRIAAQSATLNQIALTGGVGLEEHLKIIARWMGADPDQVKVEPNMDFVGSELTGRSFVEIMTAKSLGAPISQKTIHDMMVDRGATKLTYEEELALIESEEPLVAPPVEEDDDADPEREAGGTAGGDGPDE